MRVLILHTVPLGRQWWKAGFETQVVHRWHRWQTLAQSQQPESDKETTSEQHIQTVPTGIYLKAILSFFSKRIINWKWSETDHFITLHCFSSTSEFCKFSAVYLLSLHLFHKLFTLFMFVFFFSFHWFLFYSTDRLQKSYSHNCKIP